MAHLNFQIWYQICDLGSGLRSARCVAHVHTRAKSHIWNAVKNCYNITDI